MFRFSNFDINLKHMLGDSIFCDIIPPKHFNDHYYHKHLIFKISMTITYNVMTIITINILYLRSLWRSPTFWWPLLPNFWLPFFGRDDDGLPGPKADLVRALSREIEQGTSQEVILFALIYILKCYLWLVILLFKIKSFLYYRICLAAIFRIGMNSVLSFKKKMQNKSYWMISFIRLDNSH